MDIIPRIIPKKQWDKVSKGLKQRAKALNLFIDDVYNQKKIFKDNIVPKDIIYKSPYYVKECEGFSPKFKAFALCFNPFETLFHCFFGIILGIISKGHLFSSALLFAA